MAARAPLFGQEGKLGSKNSLAGLLAFPLDPRERHRRSRFSDLVSSFGRSRVRTRGWFVVIATPTVVFGCLFFYLFSHCRQAGGMKQRTQFFGSKWRFCGFMNGRGLQSKIWGKKFRRHPRAQVGWLKAQNSCRGEFEDALCSPFKKDTLHGAASLKMDFIIQHHPSVKRWILIVRRF